jgi:hypothetical protein
MTFDDEYAGCTVEDVALAVGYSDPGSEDHARAIEALRRRLPPGIGHNSPPAREVLAEELEPYRKRAEALIATAKTARITDDETAGKVLDLSQLCKAFETEIDERRKALTKPHRDAVALINSAHNRLRLEVQIARQGITGSGGLRALLTAWDDEKKAKAAEEPAGTVSAPIRGHLGQLSRRQQIAFEITDPLAVVTWLRGQEAYSAHLDNFLSRVIGDHLRSLGVTIVAHGVDIPGVSARVEQGAAYVRR